MTVQTPQPIPQSALFAAILAFVAYEAAFLVQAGHASNTQKAQELAVISVLSSLFLPATDTSGAQGS